ncbi:MAG TPA: gliding motility lipoprotein GldH [Chitinophagaceae bacterium]|nr:gliding motility lipoprotein GldH [Chitinophagaceae bacterium]
MKKSALIITLLVICAFGCDTVGVFEQTKAFANQSWAAKDSLRFNFEINDTTAFYNVYVVLRHTDAYRYSNIYINVTSINPGDTAITKRHNFILAGTTGWLGSAMDDIIEQRKLINSNPIRLKKGTYIVVLKQIMRDDPLLHILNAGVRVEKVIQ